jgi:hypothetical protein
MFELGVLDEFLKRSHQKQVHQVRARIGRDEILLGDFSLLSTPALMLPTGALALALVVID